VVGCGVLGSVFSDADSILVGHGSGGTADGYVYVVDMVVTPGGTWW
jgi:glutamine synthetase adenylyltransferase